MVKFYAVLDEARCVACGACKKVCPKDAITIHRGCYAVVNKEICVGCGMCGKICPVGCMSKKEREA